MTGQNQRSLPTGPGVFYDGRCVFRDVILVPLPPDVEKALENDD